MHSLHYIPRVKLLSKFAYQIGVLETFENFSQNGFLSIHRSFLSISKRRRITLSFFNLKEVDFKTSNCDITERKEALLCM